MIKVRATGLKEAERNLRRPLRGVMQRNFERVARLVHRTVQEEAPRKTGNLASRVSLRIGHFNFSVGDGGVKYARWVREGTAGHSIYPVKKRALWWPGLARPVASVAHPGIRHPNPYPQRAVARATPEINRLLPLAAAEIVRELGG